MNRALLLVICDFLLLSLLALANFDNVGDENEEVAEVEEFEMELATSDQDLMEALKLSLEEERASQTELRDDLDLTQQALLEREETLAEREARLEALAADLERREAERLRLEEERSSLEERVTEATAGMETLAQERAAQEEEARRARERALEMERELRQNLALLEERQERLAQLESRQAEAEEANRQLSTELQLSESEKRLIRENLEYARTEVTLARQEKDRVQEHARELAQGVTQLAERSGELAREFRTSQPKTSATIFSEFQENQVDARFNAARTVLLGPVNRRHDPRTILVTDGHQVYALFHIEKTALSLREAVDWERLSGQLEVSDTNGRMPIRELSFLSIDPRIVVVPLNQSTAESFGKKIYPIASEPFRFSEAVLINSGGNYYGESPYTIDSDHGRYLRMPRRILSRLFGEFSPSRGDLVFSKADELIGVMVNDEYAVLIDNFLPAGRIQFGHELPPTGQTLGQMKDRVDRLPSRLRN